MLSGEVWILLSRIPSQILTSLLTKDCVYFLEYVSLLEVSNKAQCQ